MAREKVSDELKKYGYVFSRKRAFLFILMIFAGIICLGYLFKLRLFYKCVLFGVGLFFLPQFVLNSAKSRYIQGRFSDINVYIEQFLYSFEKSGKILDSLRDVESIFDEGTMKTKINMAIRHIENSYDSKAEEEALGILEREYGYEGLKMVHEFAISVEREGGEYRSSAKILLDDRRKWMDRTIEFINEKRKARTKNIMSIIMSLLLCSLIYILSNRMDIDVATNQLVQLGTTIVVSLDILILYLSDRKMAEDYLSVRDVGADRAVSLQVKWNDFKTKPRMFKRFIWEMDRKTVIREIEKVFPQWILNLALLLQNDNVQVSLEKSLEDSPDVLRRNLAKLIEELKVNPTGIKPYISFMKQYEIPDIESTMKVLYSLSENGNGSSESELEEILTRNRMMIDRAGKLKNEDAMAGMSALFFAPQITAGAKMICDMLVMFTIYLSDINSIGL